MSTLLKNGIEFIETYYRHHEDVRKYFHNRPDDLLEMDITAGDGWEKLCPFLGLSIPSQPFRESNKRKDGIVSGTGFVVKKIAQAKNKIFPK